MFLDRTRIQAAFGKVAKCSPAGRSSILTRRARMAFLDRCSSASPGGRAQQLSVFSQSRVIFLPEPSRETWGSSNSFTYSFRLRCSVKSVRNSEAGSTALTYKLCLLFIHPPAHGSEVSPAVPWCINTGKSLIPLTLRFFAQKRNLLIPLELSGVMHQGSPAARNSLDSAPIPTASKLLICGLFQKGRVLAQDGILPQSALTRRSESRPRPPRSLGHVSHATCRP